MISFLTSNKGKLTEAEAILGKDIRGLELELTEIQELDPHKIIQAKLAEALKHHPGPLMVEDTSLVCAGLGGLPGPLIKWFLEGLGTEGLAKLVMATDTTRAQAITVIGYAESPTQVHYFCGVLDGEIVLPQGNRGFGWDPIFLPDGFSETLGELLPNEKNAISMRKKALVQLRDYLDK